MFTRVLFWHTALPKCPNSNRECKPAVAPHPIAAYRVPGGVFIYRRYLRTFQPLLELLNTADAGGIGHQFSAGRFRDI